jgi:hypothetical protein
LAREKKMLPLLSHKFVCQKSSKLNSLISQLDKADKKRTKKYVVRIEF